MVGNSRQCIRGDLKSDGPVLEKYRLGQRSQNRTSPQLQDEPASCCTDISCIFREHVCTPLPPHTAASPKMKRQIIEPLGVEVNKSGQLYANKSIKLMGVSVIEPPFLAQVIQF
jgi:hypothetical protein